MLTLPINMVAIKTDLLGSLNEAVIPRLKPTVPKADTHSKRIFNKPLSRSKKLTVKKAINIMIKDKIMVANALFTDFWEISDLNTSIFCFPFARLIKLSMAMANVLVFIPPPVDPGDAPTHIKKMTVRIVGKVSTALSTELNPAVLVVTDPKKAVTIFPQNPFV